MKIHSRLKQLLVATLLLAAVSAAYAFVLQPDAVDRAVLATGQAMQFATANADDTHSTTMAWIALLVMGLIAKRRSKLD